MKMPWRALPLIAAACLTFPTAAAAADELPTFQETADTWTSCHEPKIENPFLFDGDSLDYVLSPSGSFEGEATGWQYFDGAGVAAGNDPFGLQEGADEQVLNLPPGSSAVSPLMCVDLDFPTFRFALQQLADDQEKLKVEVIYPDVDRPKFRKVAMIRADHEDGWGLTDHLALEPERGGVDPGGRRMAMRFTVSGDSAAPATGYQLDDVYVDPRCRN